MFRLAHISDLHFFQSLHIPIHRLFNKRITGYVNLFLHRRFQHDPGLIRFLLENIKKQNVDHVVVTGDLTNLSLGTEFAGVREMFLDAGFSTDEVSVIPGNHDRYTKGSQHTLRFEGYLSPFMKSDIDLWDHNFPFVRLRGEVAIIGVNSALSLPPLFAGGKIGIEQLTRLEVILHHHELKDRFVVFLIHHPPYRHPGKQMHVLEGLQDYRKFFEAIHLRSALVLHGHLHRNICRRFESNGKKILISGVSSSSFKFKGVKSEAISSFNVFDLDSSGVRSVWRFKYNRALATYEPSEIGEERFLPVHL